MSRQSNRFSMETDSTIRDIWTISQQPSSEFNPQQMNEALNRTRQIRRDAGGGGESAALTGLLEGNSPISRQDDVSRAMKRRGINLKKSIAMLDEAVGSPPALRPASARRTPMTQRHNAYTPRHIPSGSHFDVSMMATPGSRLQDSYNDSRRENSMLQGDSNRCESVLPDNVTSNVAVMLEDDPSIPDCCGLYGEFMQTMQSNSSEHQLFQLLDDYEALCCDNVSLLKKLSKSTIPGNHKSAKMLDTYELLSQEMCTWRLVAALYKDRLETELKAEEQPMMLDNLDSAPSSEQELVRQLYERETSLRQAQLVVDWLERNAADTLDDYYDRVEFFLDSGGSGGGAAWENSLHDLQQQRQRGGACSQQLVTELDPDAPCRQRRELSDLDGEDEARLLMYLFAHIRAGKLTEAQELCHKVGQPWRAATLEGWRLYHDANYSSNPVAGEGGDGMGVGGEVAPIQGNHYRDVWKTVCWNMAEEERLSVHERAMYATYSGNLPRLLPVCDSWSDFVWAYLRVHVDQRVEQELRLHANTHGRQSLAELPQGFLDKMMSMESIFQEIQASPNDVVRMQASERFAVIQRYVIVGDVGGLLEEMHEWSRTDTCPPHLLRFMAHLVLFFRTVGTTSAKEELCIVIVEAYVRHLIRSSQTALVATYVAALPQDSTQVDWYASFLEGIRGTEARKECLMYGERAGLNLHAITRTVVENIRTNHGPPPPEFMAPTDADVPRQNDNGIISEDDQEKIDSLEWLVFDPAQRAEAMRQANTLMRACLTTRKLTATKAAMAMLPDDSIHVIMQMWNRQTTSTELSAEDDNTVREYLCIKAYLEAHDSFNDWFAHYQHGKPRALAPVSASATFTERVAQEHRERQYGQEVDRWKHALQLQTETTVEKLYNVLLFPNGGWMVDMRDDVVSPPAAEHRALQMRPLRQLCLPELAVLLHTVLHSAGDYTRALQLADTIAAEATQLYMVFSKEQLQKLMQKFRESSVALLDQNKDPMGYSHVEQASASRGQHR